MSCDGCYHHHDGGGIWHEVVAAVVGYGTNWVGVKMWIWPWFTLLTDAFTFSNRRNLAVWCTLPERSSLPQSWVLAENLVKFCLCICCQDLLSNWVLWSMVSQRCLCLKQNSIRKISLRQEGSYNAQQHSLVFAYTFWWLCQCWSWFAWAVWLDDVG